MTDITDAAAALIAGRWRDYADVTVTMSYGPDGTPSDDPDEWNPANVRATITGENAGPARLAEFWGDPDADVLADPDPFHTHTRTLILIRDANGETWAVPADLIVEAVPATWVDAHPYDYDPDIHADYDPAIDGDVGAPLRRKDGQPIPEAGPHLSR